MPASAALQSSERARVLAFEGGCNFRDIGGYRTHDDRLVRWGKVYRTGVLSYFTPNDRASLMNLGIRSICDLRRLDEREREPTRWPDATVDALTWGDGESAPTIRMFAANRAYTAAGMFDSMIDLYRALPEWMGPRLRGMFECLAHGRSPLVVHCAAGKDRTGIAIAVLLRVLNVSRDTVLEDYLLTNDAGDFEEFIRSQHAAQLGVADEKHPLLTMPDDIRRVLFSADAAFLEAAFEVIEKDFGGLDSYLERIVGVSPDTRARVLWQMLER